MDYDQDGIQDIISGSYDPGDIYLIRGQGDGKYAKVEKIFDENGVALVHHPIEMEKYQSYKTEKEAQKKTDYVPDSDEATQLRIASFGSWPAAVDWDADGDLDMLIGTFSGQMFLRTNVGSRNEPKFNGDAIQVMASGKPLKETGHAAPVVVDWDGDGLWDLVVGSSDGSVGWYRNTGSSKSPEFASRQILVEPKATGKFQIQYVGDYEETSPGVRAQVCVTDYNQDGKLDLIVGDYKNVIKTKVLSDEDQSKFDALIHQEQKFMDQIVSMSQEFAQHYKEMNEAERKKAEDEIQAFVDQHDGEAITAEKKKYCETGDDGQGKIVSNVWLYLRTSDNNQASEAMVSQAK